MISEKTSLSSAVSRRVVTSLATTRNSKSARKTWIASSPRASRPSRREKPLPTVCLTINGNCCTEGDWGNPGDATTPDNKLPVVRLHPPGSTEWFIELLTVPESESDLGRKDIRIVTSRGHFSLCSFGFLSLAEFEPIHTPFGIAIARPETMALANLLHHPAIGEEPMSGLIGGRRIKRSNKDLGRVLALAYLAEARQEDSLLEWPQVWAAALQSRFPTIWRDLIPKVGNGLRQLIQPENETDLDEARHTCEYGLLVSQAPSLKLLEVTGKRLLQDAIEPLEKLAKA